MAKSNLKHQILAATDFRIRAVDVPEWGVTVHVRSLNVLESIEYDKAMEDLAPEKKVAMALTFVLCDADGSKIFEQSEVDELCAKDPTVLARVFDQALALISPDEVTTPGETAEGK